MKTINIKGKEYVEVNERVKYFLTEKKYDGWHIETELLSNENAVCVMKAIIKDEAGMIRATGHAYEKEDDSSSFVNKTSYIENCETSAVGRALGFLGIGIDTSIASADEVANAIRSQDNRKTGLDFEEFREKCEKMDIDELRKEYVLVGTNNNYSDKQKEALKKIINDVKDNK